MISSIDNANAEGAALASRCAQTLVVLHQAERDLSNLPRTPRVPRCFRTLCREHGTSNDYRNAMTRHGNRGVGDGVYGEFPIAALYREICRLPWVRI